MFLCIKWQQHIFNSNIVPASNDGTMKHNFSLCSTGSTTLTCRVKRRSLRTSGRDDHSKASYCHLILGSTDTHTAPTLAKFSVKLLQFSLAETAQYVTRCSWCCMQGIALLITPATIWSPIYLNLWMCLVRDSNSGLFIFLIQILIWSYSVAVISQLYLAWIQDKETHTHFRPISWQFSIPPVPYTLPAHSVQVLVLQMTCQTHFGSKLAASSAATYSSSRCGCATFWSVFVTKDCKQSQSSLELMWKEWSPNSTAPPSSTIYMFHLYMAHTCTLLPAVTTSHSPVGQHHSTLDTKWEDCNHSTVSVPVSISKQWLAGA